MDDPAASAASAVGTAAVAATAAHSAAVPRPPAALRASSRLVQRLSDAGYCPSFSSSNTKMYKTRLMHFFD